ncbi:large ribosomal subunit protein uL23m-like [Lineus longissimus]|uniref:large ribosomal subunit protein uL23m-like n=1 Tax=Lineus longissimus TaxID=88925 RepID=UPI002B4D446B
MSGKWASYRSAKFWVPLWKRAIPRYPLYWKGNPQHRIFLPLFWMKMVKTVHNRPKDTVVFECHPQMTSLDIKQYLKKIYGVDVLGVKTGLNKAPIEKHPLWNFEYPRGPEIKRAYVQLRDTEFEFPDIFAENKPPEEKQVEDFQKVVAETIKEKNKAMEKTSIPTWFR